MGTALAATAALRRLEIPNPTLTPTLNPNPTPTLNSFTLTLRQVILIAFLPQLLENRCVGNCREFAKEMGFY